VQDDPGQLQAAVAVMQADSLWVSKTVLLETEWVLRYTYKLAPEAILAVLRKLLGYRALQAEDRGAVLLALSLFQRGLDFADALHLASSTAAERFATFDRTLAKIANAETAEIPTVELLTGSPEGLAGRRGRAPALRQRDGRTDPPR